MWLVRDRMQSEMWKRPRAESWGTVNFRVGGRGKSCQRSPRRKKRKQDHVWQRPREEQGLEVTSSGSLELGCAHSFLQNVASSRLPVSSAFAAVMKYFTSSKLNFPCLDIEYTSAHNLSIGQLQSSSLSQSLEKGWVLLTREKGEKRQREEAKEKKKANIYWAPTLFSHHACLIPAKWCKCVSLFPF